MPYRHKVISYIHRILVGEIPGNTLSAKEAHAKAAAKLEVGPLSSLVIHGADESFERRRVCPENKKNGGSKHIKIHRLFMFILDLLNLHVIDLIQHLFYWLMIGHGLLF